MNEKEARATSVVTNWEWAIMFGIKAYKNNDAKPAVEPNISDAHL